MKSLAEHLGTLPDQVQEDRSDAWTLSNRALSAEEFATLVVNSPEYRQSILHRIILGELAPAVECRILEYAWGKPIERLEVKDTTDDVDEMDVEQCEREAMRLLEIARQLRAEGVPAQEVLH